jgi:hypothetical protein
LNLGAVGGPADRVGEGGPVGKGKGPDGFASAAPNAGASATLVQSVMGKTASSPSPAADAGQHATGAGPATSDAVSGGGVGFTVSKAATSAGAASAAGAPDRTRNGAHTAIGQAPRSWTSPSPAIPEPPARA